MAEKIKTTGDQRDPWCIDQPCPGCTPVYFPCCKAAFDRGRIADLEAAFDQEMLDEYRKAKNGTTEGY